jgi:ABC-type microcin C transport system permease subunit YejE
MSFYLVMSPLSLILTAIRKHALSSAFPPTFTPVSIVLSAVMMVETTHSVGFVLHPLPLVDVSVGELIAPNTMAKKVQPVAQIYSTIGVRVTLVSRLGSD